MQPCGSRSSAADDATRCVSTSAYVSTPVLLRPIKSNQRVNAASGTRIGAGCCVVRRAERDRNATLKLKTAADAAFVTNRSSALCYAAPSSCRFDADAPTETRRGAAARFVAAAACAVALATLAGPSHPALAAAGESKKAIAVLRGTEGSEQVHGILRFSQEKEGAPVKVIGEVNGLKAGLHGIHVYAQGDISSKDGSGIGGHFNPSGSQHGDPDGKERHAGDLGNLIADTRGIATIEREFDTGMQLSGSKSIIGRALAISADPDDYHTQPEGNSGPPVAQGVIGVTN